MRVVHILLLACACGVLRAQDAASFSGLDPEAAVRIAATIPLLTVNLNNYKHPGNPILVAGPAGAWDENGIERVAVLRLAANDWRMWYSCTGTRRAIGLATSKDGVTWMKHAGNPVFRPTEPWEGTFLSPTSVLQVNGRFYLYYWAPGHVFPDPATGKLPRPPMKYIGLVTSVDGIHWTRQGNVDGNTGAVLGPGPPGINEHAEAMRKRRGRGQGVLRPGGEKVAVAHGLHGVRAARGAQRVLTPLKKGREAPIISPSAGRMPYPRRNHLTT